MKRNRERNESYINTESEYRFARQMKGLTHKDRENLVIDYATKLLIALRVDQEQKATQIRLLEYWQVGDMQRFTNKMKKESALETKIETALNEYKRGASK